MLHLVNPVNLVNPVTNFTSSPRTFYGFAPAGFTTTAGIF